MTHALPPSFWLCLGGMSLGGMLVFGLTARLLRRLRRPRPLHGFLRCQGATAAVEFLLVIVLLVQITLVTWQLGFLACAHMVVDGAAFHAVRSAVVTIPEARPQPDLDPRSRKREAPNEIGAVDSVLATDLRRFLLTRDVIRRSVDRAQRLIAEIDQTLQTARSMTPPLFSWTHRATITRTNATSFLEDARRRLAQANRDLRVSAGGEAAEKIREVQQAAAFACIGISGRLGETVRPIPREDFPIPSPAALFASIFTGASVHLFSLLDLHVSRLVFAEQRDQAIGERDLLVAEDVLIDPSEVTAPTGEGAGTSTAAPLDLGARISYASRMTRVRLEFLPPARPTLRPFGRRLLPSATPIAAHVEHEFHMGVPLVGGLLSGFRRRSDVPGFVFKVLGRSVLALEGFAEVRPPGAPADAEPRRLPQNVARGTIPP